MNRLRFLARSVVMTCCMLMLTAAVGRANPIGGSATLFFQDGATLSGYFNYDPGANAIADWQFTSTAFGTSHVYDSNNTAAGASAIILSNSNNNQVFSFGQNFDDRYEIDIVINCGGTANCVTFGAPNMSYSIVGGFVPCAPGELKCISSGEQRSLALGEKYLTSGFFNLSDPPGTVAFNVDSTLAQGFTLYTGGGDDTHVPEPSSLLLLGTGVVGLVAKRKKRLGK